MAFTELPGYPASLFHVWYQYVGPPTDYWDRLSGHVCPLDYCTLMFNFWGAESPRELLRKARQLDRVDADTLGGRPAVNSRNFELRSIDAYVYGTPLTGLWLNPKCSGPLDKWTNGPRLRRLSRGWNREQLALVVFEA